MNITSDNLEFLVLVGSNLMIMLTFFGLTVTLLLSFKKDTASMIREIKEEMKDFHERLLKIEMERLKNER